MIYYNDKKYSRILDDVVVKKLETMYDVKCLCGGVVGSRAWGGAWKESDYDFLFLFESNSNHHLRYYTDLFLVDFGRYNVDLEGYNVDLVTQQSSIENKDLWNYPTFYTNNRQLPKDDCSIEIFRILSSEYIWDSGYLQKHLSRIVCGIEPILLLNYLFSRVAGHLEKNLSINTVSMKIILRTLYNLNCMLWILKYHTYPYLDIVEMASTFQPGPIKQKIFEIVHACESRTSELTLPRDDELNMYIKEQLKEIELAIKSIQASASTFEILLDPNSFLGKLSISDQFKHQEGMV